jgi:L-fucose isomerase
MYQKRKTMVDEEIQKIHDALSGYADIVIEQEVRFLDSIVESAKAINSSQLHTCIIHVPTWVNPNIVISTANLVERPLLVLGNKRPQTASMVGWLAVCGGLDEIGKKYKRLMGSADEPEVAQQLQAFAKATYAFYALKGQRFGLFGVRSLGMYTASHDPNQWQQLFGIDTEVFDQLEIVRIADSISTDQVDSFRTWFTKRIGAIDFDGTTFTPEKLEKQIRSYLATRQIIEKQRLNFTGVKCQPELSDGYCLQCLNIAMLNDPFDERGSKKVIPTACESDANGALTMQFLSLLSGGKPVSLMDIKLFRESDDVLVLANCGGMALSFSSNSINPEEYMKNVEMHPHLFGDAGGGATQFVVAPGVVTVARLVRVAGRYKMFIIPGETIDATKADLVPTGWSWPHAFIKMRLDLQRFLQVGASNHLHLVKGDYVNELIELCQLFQIEYEIPLRG